MSKPIVESIDDLSKDIAGTTKFLKVKRDVDPDIVEADWHELQANGYVIMENLISDDEADAIKADLMPLFDKKGRNEFEGELTQRIYSTLAKTRSCDGLATHPRILALLDRLFMPNYLMSQLLGINILPGETAQYLHPDDGFYPVPRPRPPLGAASIFALDAFTKINGATQFVPGSHLWGDRKPTKDDTVISAVMPKGSAAFYLGTFWHGGGANNSDAPRMALSAQYCEPWLRQQENLMMAIPKDIVKKLDPQLQSMLGYSILPPYIGMVSGQHPLKQLED